MRLALALRGMRSALALSSDMVGTMGVVVAVVASSSSFIIGRFVSFTGSLIWTRARSLVVRRVVAVRIVLYNTMQGVCGFESLWLYNVDVGGFGCSTGCRRRCV